MAQKQNSKKALLCTHKNCRKLQTEDGEFCEKHYPKKEKEYHIEVDIKFSQILYAKNKTEAIIALKQTFYDEYNICDISSDEIKKITEIT